MGLLSGIPIIGDIVDSVFGSGDNDSSGSGGLVNNLLGTAGNYLSWGLNSPMNNYIRHQQSDDAKDLMVWQNNLAKDLWQHQFSTLSQYNDPAAAKARYLNAGLSPQSMLGGTTVGQMSSPSPAMTSIPSFVGQGNLNFSSLAQALNLASSTRLNDARIPEIDSHIRQLLSDANLKDKQAEFQDLSTKLESIFGAQLRRSQVRESLGRYVNLLAQSALYAEQGKTEESKRALNDSQRELNNAKKALTDEQKTAVEYENKFAVARQEAMIDETRARAERHRTGAALDRQLASYYNALTKTENDLRDGKITGLQLSNAMQEVQNRLARREDVRDAATHQDKISAIVSECEAKGLINEKTRQDIYKAMQENDWYAVQQMCGVIGTVMGAYTSNINALSGVEKVQIQSKIADSMSKRNHTKRVFDDKGNLQGWYEDSFY